MLEQLTNVRREMPRTRLEVGVASVHASGSEEHENIINGLVQKALRPVDLDAHPVRWRFLLSTGGWCQSCPELPRLVRNALERESGVRPPLIGGSMAMLFSTSEEAGKQVISEGLALVLLGSEELYVSVGFLEKPYDRSQDGSPTRA